MKDELLIFTDGASKGNPGPGGFGAVLYSKKLNEIIELGGGSPKTTNNVMELSAMIAGLSYAMSNSSPTKIYTDSKYVIEGITKWINGWRRNGWKTKTGEPVKNDREWKTLYELYTERTNRTKVELIHVNGHVGIPGNERVDEIATAFAEGKNPKMFRGTLNDYSVKDIEDITPKMTKPSSSNHAKAYSYLSMIGDQVVRHTTWEDCKLRVTGKKAKFKKALSPMHEEEILKEWGVK